MLLKKFKNRMENTKGQNNIINKIIRGERSINPNNEKNISKKGFIIFLYINRYEVDQFYLTVYVLILLFL